MSGHVLDIPAAGRGRRGGRRRPLAQGAVVSIAAVLAISACSGSTSSAAPAGTQPPSAGSVAPSVVSSPSSPGAHQTESNPPGDIPDQQVFVDYTTADGKVTVKVPEGWARSQTSGEVSSPTSSTRSPSPERPAAAALTEAAATSTVRSAIGHARCRPSRAAASTTVTRKAGQAVLVTYVGDSAPDPVTNKVVQDAFERYSFWRAGTEVVVTLSGPKGADNVDPWKIVTDSVRWSG